MIMTLCPKLKESHRKNTLLCKMREKNNLSRGKIPAPPNIKWSVPYVSNVSNVISKRSFN